MSFCNPNRRATRGLPGAIGGNQTSGLCESVALEVKRVFDGCISRSPRENIQITVTTEGLPVQPYTFVSCSSTSNKGILHNVTYTPIENSTRRQVVTADLDIPTTINFLDATGMPFSGSGFLRVPISTVLCVPENSIVPVTCEAVTAVTCFSGEYIGGNVFSINCCTLIIVKLVMEVEMLFPTYGYVDFPECRDAGELACRGFFNTPLYPFAPRNTNANNNNNR